MQFRKASHEYDSRICSRSCSQLVPCIKVCVANIFSNDRREYRYCSRKAIRFVKGQDIITRT